jgi:hypothetical protein
VAERHDPPAAGPERYVLCIKEHISETWSHWLDEMLVTYADTGETRLTGLVADQAALHGLLAKVRDLNLTLLSVNRLEPDARPGGCHEGSHETAEDPT